MLDFPPSTVFNKWVPKKKFYENLSISSRIEKQFVTEIESVYWTHKLSPETLNVSPGTREIGRASCRERVYGLV